MTKPLPLDTVMNELSDDDEMWVLHDQISGLYVVIPDPRFPGRRPIRFFMKREDAESILTRLLEANELLRNANIISVKVKTKAALIGIASDKNKANADSFVVHPPNEVFEYLHSGV